MKLICMLAILAAVASATGCGQKNNSAVDAAPKPAVTADDVKREVGEAASVTKDYAVQGKDQFVASAEQKLKELDRKIDELAVKAGSLKDDAKAEAGKALDALREERARLGPKLDELKKSSQDAWKEIKAGCESAMGDLEKAVENAKSKF